MPNNEIMILAGEPSGDALAADVLRKFHGLPAGMIRPTVFGLGGPKLEAMGVELIEDMTRITVFGLVEVLRQYAHYKRIFQRTLREAIRRQPKVIVFVDFGGFNLRFAKAIRAYQARTNREFSNWSPKLIYFVPPQVWASREKRAATIARHIDQVISIFPLRTRVVRRALS